VRAFFFYGIKRAYIRRASSRVSTWLAFLNERTSLSVVVNCVAPRLGCRGTGPWGHCRAVGDETRPNLE
jgi:hypothetical protein